MWRVFSLIVALTFVPLAASAQQPCTTDARRVVSELYRHMLERTADASSAEHVRQLESGRVTVQDLVRSIAKSSEHNQRFFKAESGEEVRFIRSVDTLYRHILGRAADPAGARGYAERAQRDGVAPIVDELVSSSEYQQKFGAYGVPGSGGLVYCANNNAANNTWNNQNNSWSNQPGTIDSNRLQSMDVNRDGVITRSEWVGNDRAFRARDWNNDGILSGNEIDGNRSPAGTTGNMVVVSATQPWTDTGMDVRAGDMLTFDAEGNVRLSEGGGDVASASGAQSGRRAQNAPVPAAPAGGLIARIGDSAAVYVGDRRAVRAPVSGRLYLGVNDDHLGDNGGEFRVTVNVRNRNR
jgi:hypothetical protein